jgi:structure-specific recognition protein 1
VALATANGKNEVAIELQCEEAKTQAGDMLCEMRFHVPQSELDGEKDDSDSELTAAQVFTQKILSRAGLDSLAGSLVTSVHDLPMLIPRGNYTLEFLSSVVKLHGKTHDYKISFKDINKIFLLQKPDQVHMVYLIQLNQALRQGNTMHYFIAMQFDIDRECKLKLNLTAEELQAKGLNSEIDGKLYDVLS